MKNILTLLICLNSNMIFKKSNFYVCLITLIVLYSFACQSKSEPYSRGEQKPNVLMICIDDLNDWVGCMGGNPSALTPNIDKLASQGTLFTNAHCQTSLCGPSRASIMSGLRPSTTGIYGQISDDDLRDALVGMEEVTFLPEYFGVHGYKTMGVGKIFHGHAPEGVFQQSGGRVKGFGPKPADGKRYHWDRKGTSTDWAAFPDVDEKMPDYKSAQWAKDRLEENHDKPFFLTVGFLRPHVPWYVPQKWFDKHPIDQVQLPPYLKDDKNDVPEIAARIDTVPMMPTTEWAIKTGKWKDIVQSYLASTTFVDHYVGEVLRGLERSRYKDNTIVILWSDHGYRLGEKGTFAKHSLYREATNVPLIIKTPNAVPASLSADTAGRQGRKRVKNDRPVELLDIYPTLLDLCGLPTNTMNEGKSLRPLLNDPNVKWEKAAISTFGQKNHAIVTDNYKYIRYEDGEEELYDRAADPNEWTNLADKAEMIGTKSAMERHLPTINAEWAKASYMRHNEYFRQKMAEKSSWIQHTIDNSSTGADGIKFGDINEDGLVDFVTGWEEGGFSKLYINPGLDKVRQKWPSVIVGETKNVEDAVFADMNNDGKLDIVSCTENRSEKIFVHFCPAGDLLDAENWKQFTLPASDTVMPWMYAQPLQIDGKYGLDLVAGGKGKNGRLGWFEAPQNKEDLGGWKWHPISKMSWVMSILFRDMDGDGDDDIVVTDRKFGLQGARWLENPGAGEAQKQEWESHFIGCEGLEVMFMTMADVDGDGTEEAIVTERTNETIRIYKRKDNSGREWSEHIIQVPATTGRCKSIEAGDINGDGVLDLVLSTNTGREKEAGITWLDGHKLKNPQPADFQAISGVHVAKYDKVELVDLDRDGDLDVLICEENYGENSEGLGVVWYENRLRG